MAKTGEDYELLVRHIFDQIVNQDFQGVKTIEVKHNVKIEGKSRNKHQIDVYWEFYFADAKHCAIIEVKDKSRPVSKADMESFIFRLQDIPNQPRGYYISRKGFQSGAKNLAEQNGIKIMTLDTPDENFWRGKMKNLHFRITMNTPHIENFRSNIDEKWLDINEDVKDTLKEIGSFHVLASESYICDSSGNKKLTIGDVIKQEISEYSEKEMTERTHVIHKFIENDFYFFPQNGGIIVKADSIEFDLSFSQSEENLHIDGGDVLPFIMRDILEGTVRAIDNTGKVRGSQPVQTDKEIEKALKELTEKK